MGVQMVVRLDLQWVAQKADLMVGQLVDLLVLLLAD